MISLKRILKGDVVGHEFHGNQWTNLDDAPNDADVPDDNKSYQTSADALRQSIASGVKSSRRLSGGAVAESVKLVTYRDGKQAVVKTLANNQYAQNQQDALDKEVLISQLAPVMGANIPTVIQTGPREMTMSYISGQTGDDYLDSFDDGSGSNKDAIDRYNEEFDKLASTESGYRLGVLDEAVDNQDRNGGNWVRDDDGNVVGIDHEFSEMATNPYVFTDYYTSNFGKIASRLPKATIASIRDDVRSSDMSDVFAAAGRLNWYQGVMSNLDQMVKKARR